MGCTSSSPQSDDGAANDAPIPRMLIPIMATRFNNSLFILHLPCLSKELTLSLEKTGKLSKNEADI